MAVTMTDLFCGAGGSSAGAAMVPGLQVELAVNHWPLAVASHAANHPDTEHRVADISQLDPSSLPRSQVYWASPECTTFSQAAPVRPDDAVARSRATAWDVLRIAEHRVDTGCGPEAIVVENVPAMASWRFFGQWQQMLTDLGYDQRLVYLNSAAANVAGPSAPQLRDRMYVVCWRRDVPAPDLDRWLSPRARCPRCGPVRAVQRYRRPREEWSFRGVPGVSAGRYRAQYDYRCPGCDAMAEVLTPVAADVLDVASPGAPVTSRSLVPRTRARIRAGIARTRAAGPDLPGGRRGFVMRNNGSPGDGAEHCSSLGEPLRTLTTAGHQCLVTYPRTGSLARQAERARMRFLTPGEVALAMGFPRDYALQGTSRDQLRQLGNAVTPPAARDLLSAVVEAVTGQAVPTVEDSALAAA